jgi:hypothetical protein
MHDVQSSPAVELGVLEPLGGIESSVRSRCVVQDLRERSPDMIVVVEDFVVVAARPVVALDENLVRKTGLTRVRRPPRWARPMGALLNVARLIFG